MVERRSAPWREAATGAEIGIGLGAAQDTAPAPGTALLPITPVDLIEPPKPGRQRANATFITQLIATDRQFPQTRERRRAEPHEALAAYGAVARMVRDR